MIIALDDNKNAEGELFYDDGESIETISNKQYYYAKFQWIAGSRKLIFNVMENNYPKMKDLILDSLSIYGLDDIPQKFIINNQSFTPIIKPGSQIIELRGLGLAMSINYSITWDFADIFVVARPSFVSTDPKYRIDCHPDPSNFHQHKIIYLNRSDDFDFRCQ